MRISDWSSDVFSTPLLPDISRMAVYTEIDDDQLAGLLAQYDLGSVLSCKGIAEGVENSNFMLATEKGTYFLTLYEKRVKRDDLPYFIGLMEHLAAKGQIGRAHV